MDHYSLDASDSDISDYNYCEPKYPCNIQAKIEAKDRFEAIACMEVIAHTLIKIRKDFFHELQHACSSNAMYQSAAFKLLLKIQNDLLAAINEEDLKRLGKRCSYEIYREGAIIDSAGDTLP